MPQKQNLMRAHDELFRRGPDEIFPSLQALYEFCRGEKERSDDHWRPPADPCPHSNGSLRLNLGEGSAPYRMNDWSFTQLCGLAGVSKETVNRLSPGTARRVLEETLPRHRSRSRCSPPQRTGTGGASSGRSTARPTRDSTTRTS